MRGRLRRCPVISLFRAATLLSNNLLLRRESANSTSRSPFRTLCRVPPTACHDPQSNEYAKARWEGAGSYGEAVRSVLGTFITWNITRAEARIRSTPPPVEQPEVSGLKRVGFGDTLVVQHNARGTRSSGKNKAKLPKV